MLEDTQVIRLLNKAEGGPGRPAELSLDISCQHFITVAVIKRPRPRSWPGADKLRLGWEEDEAPAATAGEAPGLTLCSSARQLLELHSTFC